MCSRISELPLELGGEIPKMVSEQVYSVMALVVYMVEGMTDSAI